MANPFFLDQENWLGDPAGWSPNIVRGKMYDTAEPAGRSVWEKVQTKFALQPDERLDRNKDIVTAEHPPKYGEPILIRPRFGQSSFRVLVTKAYQKRCAITGESTLIALEAAHIVPYAKEGKHDVRNGLLLRADFHRLFDVGLVSVTSDLRVKISPRIRESWFNGKAYYRLDDAPLSVVPLHESMRPDRDLLDWHFRNRFQT